MAAKTWDDAKDAELRRLFADGLAYSEIGKRMGVTRNACIGRGKRLKPPLPARGQHAVMTRYYADHPKTHAPKPQKAPRARFALPDSALPRPERINVPRATPARLRPAVAPALLRSLDVPLVDLTVDHCRWPVRGGGAATLFCGAGVVAKSVYCSAHSWISYPDWAP